MLLKGAAGQEENEGSPAPVTETAPAANNETLKSALLDDGGVDGDQEPLLDKAPDESGDKAPDVEYKLSAPEGAELDPGHLEGVIALAKEHGISQEAAQAILDRDAKFVALAREESEKRVLELRKSWREELAADKEYGGQKFNETVKLARSALKRFAPDGFVDELGPYKDHAGLIKLLANVERAISDDKLVTGSPAPAKPQKTDAQIMFPSMPNP